MESRQNPWQQIIDDGIQVQPPEIDALVIPFRMDPENHLPLIETSPN